MSIQSKTTGAGNLLTMNVTYGRGADPTKTAATIQVGYVDQAGLFQTPNVTKNPASGSVPQLDLWVQPNAETYRPGERDGYSLDGAMVTLHEVGPGLYAGTATVELPKSANNRYDIITGAKLAVGGTVTTAIEHGAIQNQVRWDSDFGNNYDVPAPPTQGVP